MVTLPPPQKSDILHDSACVGVLCLSQPNTIVEKEHDDMDRAWLEKILHPDGGKLGDPTGAKIVQIDSKFAILLALNEKDVIFWGRYKGGGGIRVYP